MAGKLELLGWEFKLNMINMLRDLVGKIHHIRGQMLVEQWILRKVNIKKIKTLNKKHKNKNI